MKKKFTENLYKVKSHLTILDIVVIVFLLLSSFFSYKFLKKDFNNAKIYVNNKLVKTLSLSKNQEFSIDKNTIIEIKNKKARIKKSDCKNQVCVKQGWQNKVPIICVPKKIMIKFENKNRMLITK